MSSHLGSRYIHTANFLPERWPLTGNILIIWWACRFLKWEQLFPSASGHARYRGSEKYLALSTKTIWPEPILPYLGGKEGEEHSSLWEIWGCPFMTCGKERPADGRWGPRSPRDPPGHWESALPTVKGCLWDLLKKLWFTQTMEYSWGL